MVKIKYNKTIMLLFAISSIFFIFTATNIGMKQPLVQEDSYTDEILETVSTNDQSSIKISQPSQEERVLGWEVGDQQSGFYVPGFQITVECIGIYENTVVLVEKGISDEWPTSRGESVGQFFQNRIYDPTAAVYGVPRESFDYPGSHDIALVIVDTFAHQTSWAGVYAGQMNGYEQISASSDFEWTVLAHEYQHCVYQHLRGGHERWFNEGLAEFWPNYLEIKTTNRSADHFMDAVESAGYGQNHPLIEWAHFGGTAHQSCSYGLNFMFVFYLYEQFGIDFIKSVVNDYNYTIIEAINRQLPIYGYEDMNFKEIFFNFEMALRLNNLEVNPEWGYKGVPFYIPPSFNDRDSNLPLDLNFQVFHWAGASHQLSISDSSFNALKYTFNGSVEGDFDVHVIGSSYYNMSYSTYVVSAMSINNNTQAGSLVFILPSKVKYVYVMVANANGPTKGADIPSTTALNEIRDSISLHIETVDVGLSGAFVDAIYGDRVINITANVDWELETSLQDNDIQPHVTLYDKDGEFAFNVQAELTYDSASGQWMGSMELPVDIKAGNYVVKLFVRGTELDNREIVVKGSSASGFMMFPITLTLIAMVLVRKKLFSK